MDWFVLLGYLLLIVLVGVYCFPVIVFDLYMVCCYWYVAVDLFGLILTCCFVLVWLLVGLIALLLVFVLCFVS